jgi:AcrR family transcriptional regulator
MLWGMPRVSEAHLAARRDQILEAATRCFARSGFHATSMQDVIGEAGLSVGAVYRYFRSKEELRRAIAEHNVFAMAGALDEIVQQEPALPLPQAMARALDVVEPRLGRYGFANIALQVWAEAVRDPELGDFVTAALTRLRGGFITLAERARDAGHLSADVDAVGLGTALFSIMPGYVVQRVITGRPDRDTMGAAVNTLLTTRCG